MKMKLGWLWPWDKNVSGPAEGAEIGEELRKASGPSNNPSVIPVLHNYSYPIPLWELSQRTRRAFRQSAIVTLENRCSLITGAKNITVRQLLSKDLGLKSWRTPPQLSGERSVWINHELERHQFIVITGVIQLSANPKVSEIIFREGLTGCNIRGMVEIDEIYSILPIIKKLAELHEDDALFARFGQLQDIRMAAYFGEPYLYDNATVNISVTSPVANKTGDRLMLSGFIMEPLGMTIG